MRPGPIDLARLRRQPHRTKVYLGIYKPSVALACQINDADIPHSAREITYDSITEGSADLVIPGMTVYIGSNPGGFDRGRLRVKSISDPVLTVAENDTIEWADNLYLTVKRFFEPWGIYPRITLDDENVPSFFKDYDIAYTDQNQVFDPVVHMGPHLAAFRETGTVSLDYSSSGSFDPADESTPTGTAWWFEGATPTGSGNPHPSLIQYPTSGHYTTHLTVVSDQGKSFTGRRHVMIFDRPGQGDNPPIIGWGLIGIEGQRSSMGYTARMFVKEKADFDKVVNGALVVLFTEDWYGDEKVSIGGNAVDRSNILFVGYIDGESVRYNSFTSRLEFRASSITIIGDLKSDFSDTLESTVSTAFWYEMQNMTIDKAVLHFLRWQSTLLSIADFSWAGNILPVQFADFGRSTVSAEVNDLYESALGASLIADRQGKMWAEVDINLTLTGSRSAFVENMELLRQDWVSEIGFDREFIDRVSYIEEGGLAYSGPASGTMEPLLAGAPGLAPSYEGSVVRRTGLVLESQAQINAFAGLDFARRNMTYPRVDITLAGNYRNFDIAPQEFVLLSLAEADTYRNIVWRGKRFIPQSISISYDPRKELLQYNMTVEEETWAPTGTTVDIPVDPPYDQLDLPSWEIEFPPIQIPEIWVPPVNPQPSSGNLVYMVHYNSFARSRNFWDDDPNWEAVGVTGTIGSYRAFYLDPADAVNGAMLLTYVLGEGPHIFYTSNLDDVQPAWVEVWGTTESDTHLGLNSGRKGYELAPKIGTPGTWFMVCSTKELGGGAATAVIAKTVDYGTTWTSTNSGFPADNALDGCITPSPYNSTVWCVAGGGPPGVTAHHFRSTNDGAFWVLRTNFADGVGPIFLLEDDTNPNRAVIAQEGALRITANGGGSYSAFGPVDIVGTWGIAGSEFQQRKRMFISHPSNAWMYALLQTGGTYAFWARQGVGGTWEKRHTFVDAVSGMIGFNPSDPTQFITKGTINDFNIMGSLDGGRTWLNKEGDFEAAVDLFTNLSTTVGFQVGWS